MVCYEVQNSLLWKGGKNTAKTRPLSPLRDRKKQKFLDLTRRGKSNDIAHRPIIQVFTVSICTINLYHQSGLHLAIYCSIHTNTPTMLPEVRGLST